VYGATEMSSVIVELILLVIPLDGIGIQ